MKTELNYLEYFFSFFGSRLVLASTDSYRLAEKEININWQGESIENQKFIVQQK